MKHPIAVFGGAFNPVHLGHMVAAGEVLRLTPCKEVWFMPAYMHAEKSPSGIIDIKHRVAMLRLAVKGLPNMKVSMLEVQKARRDGQPNFTADTLALLKKKFSRKEFWWVAGSNLVSRIPRWEKAEELPGKARIVVVTMEGAPVRKPGRFFLSLKPLYLKNAVTSSISSTLVRRLIRQGKSFEHLVGEKVASYIKKHRLYK